MSTLTMAENPMAKEKPEKPPAYELTKIEAELLESARFIVAADRQIKGKVKSKTLAAYLSDVLRPTIERDLKRVRSQIASEE